MLSRALSIAFLFVLLGNTATAQVTVNTEGLSDGEKAKLVQMAEDMRKAQQTTAQITPEKVNEWAELGTNVATAITSAAKEIGIASDQFLMSTTGKITMVLIIWKVAGKDLVALGVGLFFLLTFVPLWTYFFRRMCLVKNIVQEPIEGNLRMKRTYEYYGGNTPKEVHITRVIMLIVLGFIVVAGLAVAL